jgi:hypothetical protein
MKSIGSIWFGFPFVPQASRDGVRGKSGGRMLLLHWISRYAMK